jgi:hypothetical protein
METCGADFLTSSFVICVSKHHHHQAVETHSPLALQESLSRLLPLVISAVNEEWYKIIAEALRVLGSYMYVYIHDVHMYSFMYMCIYIFTYKCTYLVIKCIYLCTYIYMYIHKYICVYTCMYV